MQYRNKRNGRVIDIASVLHGGEWEPVDGSPHQTGEKQNEDGNAVSDVRARPAVEEKKHQKARQAKAEAPKAESGGEYGTIAPKGKKK